MRRRLGVSQDMSLGEALGRGIQSYILHVLHGYIQEIAIEEKQEIMESDHPDRRKRLGSSPTSSSYTAVTAAG